MNFFAVRDAIIDTLRAAMPGVEVLTADDLEGIDEAAQKTPAVHVVNGGFRVDEVNRSGRSAVIEQTWIVVCVVRHDGDKRKAVREAGGRIDPHVQAVLNTLMGWRHASTGMLPLQIATPPAPRWRPPFYYFPLTFSAKVALEKSS